VRPQIPETAPAAPSLDRKALLVSVGGSPEPIVKRIEVGRPNYLLFFVSPESEGMVSQTILPRLSDGHRFLGIDFVRTPSAELIQECCRVLVTEVSRLLLARGLGWRDLAADITGGTKAMSAAVLLSLAGRGCVFSYVGAGDDQLARLQGGLGVVVNGKEKVLIGADPSDVLEPMVLLRAGRHFEAGRYAAAAAEAAWERPVKGRIGAALATAFRAFALWDRQLYDEALHALRESLPALETAVEAGDGRLTTFAAECRQALLRLERVQGEWNRLTLFVKGKPVSFEGVDGMEIPADLCAAAIRRAEMEEDPEDGVLLLYAAVEKAARGRLLTAYRINNSEVAVTELSCLVDSERPAVVEGQTSVELSLTKSYLLLSEKGDELGRRYRHHAPLLLKLQWARNNCWREHAYTHVKRATFDALLPGVLSFLGLEGKDLVKFPGSPDL
jgi:CRISPR-associated protein (TIGR02710 family)